MQALCAAYRQARTFFVRPEFSLLFFVFLGQLVPLGCREAQKTTTTEQPTSSATNSSPPATAKLESSPQQRLRILALQKPSGSPAIDREIEVIQKAAEKKPENLDNWILLGRAWAKKARQTKDPGFWLNVDASAKIVFEQEPRHRLARELVAMVLLEQHAFADAKDAAGQLLLEDPDHLEALGIKSDAALELGQFDEALAAAQKMVDLKPNLASYARAAHLRWLQGDAQAAKSIYRASFDAHDPRDPEPYAWVLSEAAMIFWNQGDIEGADKGFDKALEAFPDEPSALLGKARVALAQGDGKKAAQFAEKAYSRGRYCEAAWVLGDAHARAGEEKAANEAYQQLIDCGRKTDKRTLATFFATKNRDIEEAATLIKEEAKLRQDIHTRDTSAWIAYRQKDYATAQKEMDAALAHGTKEPILIFHAGAIQLARGEKKTGEKLLREALAMNPHFDVTGAEEAKKLLGEGPK